jgi:glutamate-ammonia-ligase adenylyltransferase
LSVLADEVVDIVLRDTIAALSPPGAEPGTLAAFALGKYGARAMDYGSDLDMMFVVDAPGDPAIAQDRAVKIAREALRRLQDRAAGARLFEVDMRLRPSGRQGAVVSTLEALRAYHTDELPVWERLALARLRPITECSLDATNDDVEGPRLGALATTVVDTIVAPSVLRPTSAEAIGAAIRALKRRIEHELVHETRDVLDVKAGPGGSLELELLVAGLALAAGVRTPPPGLGVPEELERLARVGVLDTLEVDRLREAYSFFRKLLNRLRMGRGACALDTPDRLATNSPRLDALARRMGLPGRQLLIDRLRAHRASVRAAFDRHLASEPPASDAGNRR